MCYVFSTVGRITHSSYEWSFIGGGVPAIVAPSRRGSPRSSPDCLEVIEKSVNREAEKLYGVEGQGPFDEF
jgi:hypothetical protein